MKLLIWVKKCQEIMAPADREEDPELKNVCLHATNIDSLKRNHIETASPEVQTT